MASSSRKPRARRVQAAAPAPGIAKVRLSGDPAATDALAAMLRADPAVEILAGPDKYDDGRQYLAVRVRMDGGLGRDREGMPSAARVAALEERLEGVGLLRAPCDDYRPTEPYGACTTCGRTRQAHLIAAAAAGAPWTDDDNDGGAP